MAFRGFVCEKCRSPIMWAEVGEGQLIGPKLVQENTEKISQIKDRLKAVRDRVVRFGKKGKLTPIFVGPFEIIEKVRALMASPYLFRIWPEDLEWCIMPFSKSHNLRIVCGYLPLPIAME
ncbi:hypothetical protein Tco_0607156 [Tanacetum coccineum]